MSIQVLKPKFHIDECLAQVRECLEKGWTGSGFKTVYRSCQCLLLEFQLFWPASGGQYSQAAVWLAGWR